MELVVPATSEQLAIYSPTSLILLGKINNRSTDG
jgi:hypothetical protein